MVELLEFIAKYWLQFGLGLIATGLGFVAKKFYSLYKSEKAHQKTEEQKAFYQGLQDLIAQGSQESLARTEILQNQINILKEGVLCIQGREFKQECRNYLNPDREFTVEEFEALNEEHDVYNSLGGNHNGDSLFKLVEKKASLILTNDK